MDFPSALAILASPGGHAVPRAEAESIVQAVVNDPSRGIQALCHALECDGRDDLGTRRLAAVLLSTAAARHWSVLGDDAKAAMRQRTLAALSRVHFAAGAREVYPAVARGHALRPGDDIDGYFEQFVFDCQCNIRHAHRTCAHNLRVNLSFKPKLGQAGRCYRRSGRASGQALGLGPARDSPMACRWAH